MPDPPSRRYVAATVGAAVAAVVGAWLPWIHKRGRMMDGELVVTGEGVYGEAAGIGVLDWVVVLAAVVVVGAVLVGRIRDWRPDPVLIVAPLPILALAGLYLWYYSRVDRYIADPGIYLTLAGGILLVVIGIGPHFRDVVRNRRESGIE